MISRIKSWSLWKQLVRGCFWMMGHFPGDEKLVVFESFLGRQYSCNEKAIYEHMKKHYPDYRLYWSADREFMDNFIDVEEFVIRRGSLKWYLIMARAKFWITNTHMPLWLPKPKHTSYVQTWQGTPLRKLVLDDESYKESCRWDYLISPSEYASNVFKQTFKFEKELLETGYPRNDILYNANNEAHIRQIKKRLQLPLTKKIILYAPTFRENKQKFDLALDLKRLQEQYGERYIILLRMHYLISENLDLTTYKGFVYDVSNQIDINDLYLISDLMMTDYSSGFFDYANLRRPIVFYTYDMEDYRETLKGFYFDLELEAPGPLVDNMDSVIEILDEFDRMGEFKAYREAYRDFYHKYCSLEYGRSTEQVVNHLFLH